MGESEANRIKEGKEFKTDILQIMCKRIMVH